MKKIISIMLIMMLTSMCMLSGFAPAVAGAGLPADAPANTLVLSGTDLQELLAVSQNTAKNAASGGANHLAFNTAAHWVEFTVYTETAANYDFYIRYGTGGGEFKPNVFLNGTKVKGAVLPGTTGYFSNTLSDSVVILQLTPGLNVVKVGNIAGSYAYFRSVGFKLYEDIALSGVTTNLSENVLTATEGIARGTDSFEITFNNNHKKDTAEAAGAVVLKDGDATVPAEVTSDGTKITVKLKKTLDYSKSYKLVLNGIDDTAGISSITNREIPFTTKATDLGTESATISVVDHRFDEDKIYITSKTVSSAGMPIEGRTVTVSVVKPDGTPVAESIYTGVSGVDGLTVIETALPAGTTDSGMFTINVSCEYAASPASLSMPYITETEKIVFLGDIATAKAQPDPASAVKGVYAEKANLLGIDIAGDTEGLANADRIFLHIANDAPTTGEEIITKYEKYVALEKMNQATTTAPIEGVLNSEKLCGYLGFSFEKLNLILNEKSSLLEAILTLEEIQDGSQFISKVNGLIDEAYARENSISPVDIVTENKSCYVGQIATADVTLAQATDKVKAVKVVLSADDTAILNNLSATAKEGFTAEVNDVDGKKEIIFTLAEAKDGVEKAGQIEFQNAATAKVYNITVKGDVTYDLGEDVPEVKTSFTQKTFTITVSANTSTGESTPTTRPSVAPSRPSQQGGTVVVNPPAEKEDPKEEPKDDPEEDPKDEPKEEYNFSDLAEFDWAKEAISELVEMGVISKSDDNQFNPSRNVTRAEFVKMVIVAFGFEEDGAKSDLSDVAADAWYNTYVAAAQKHGIVSGDAEGNFNGDANITRQDMAVIIKRAFEKKGLKIENVSGDTFSDDSDIADYAKEAVYMMKSAAILNGMGENTFAPKDNATRAQAAKVIYETVKAVASK